MKMRSVFSEAARNLASGTTRAGWIAVLFCFVTASAALVDAASIAGLVEKGREFRQSGSTIFVVTADNGIDGAACERLSQVRGIVHSGAVRSTTTSLRVSSLPSSPIPVKESSPRFPLLLGGKMSEQGILLPESVFETLGRRHSIETDVGRVRIASAFPFPDDGRRGGLQYAALAPVPASELFDECWVDIWPAMPTHLNLGKMSLSVAVPSDSSVQVSQLNTRLGEQFDGLEAFSARPTRWLGLGVVTICWCVGFFMVWSRRLELAGNLHSGVPKISLILQIIVESLITLALGLCGAIALIWMALGLTDTHEAASISAIVSRIPITASIAMVAGAATAGLSIRERYLFRYFRLRR